MFGVNGIDFSQIQVGNTPIAEVYIGSSLVWQLAKPYTLTVENNTNRIIHIIVNGTQIGNATANRTSEFSINEGSSVYLQYSTAGEIPYYDYYFDGAISNSISFKMDTNRVVNAYDVIITNISMDSELTFYVPHNEFYVTISGKNLNKDGVLDYILQRLEYTLNGESTLHLDDKISISSPDVQDIASDSVMLRYGVSIYDAQYYKFNISYRNCSATSVLNQNVNPIIDIIISNSGYYATDVNSDGIPDGYEPVEGYYEFEGKYKYEDNASPSLDSLKLEGVSSNTKIEYLNEEDSNGYQLFKLKVASEDFGFGTICTVSANYGSAEAELSIYKEDIPKIILTLRATTDGYYDHVSSLIGEPVVISIESSYDAHTQSFNWDNTYEKSFEIDCGSKITSITSDTSSGSNWVYVGADQAKLNESLYEDTTINVYYVWGN